MSLDEAVSGISNNGIEHNADVFTLSPYYRGIHDSQEKCHTQIIETLTDYKKRGVGKGKRFVIMPVFCFKDDQIF